MAVSFAIRSADPVAFITIDDGVTKDMRGLRFVEAKGEEKRIITP